MSVFMILAIIGSVSAANDNDTQPLSQSIDEVVNVDNTDEILTVEVSSAGNTSGLKELDSDKSDLSLSKSKPNKEVLKASNENSVLTATRYVSDPTFEGIQSVINSSNAGDTIYLSGTLIGSGTYITIDKQLTIIGRNNCTLDAQGLSSIFRIKASKTIINNITFKNGKKPTTLALGMGVTVDSTASECRIINSKFIDFYENSTYDSHALLVQGSKHIISNVTFINITGKRATGFMLAKSTKTVIKDIYYKNSNHGYASLELTFCSYCEISNIYFENVSCTNALSSHGGSMGDGYNNFNNIYINNTIASSAIILVWSEKESNYTNLFLFNNSGNYMINLHNTPKNILISDSIFMNNIGIGIRSTGINTTVKNCNFVNNSGTTSGAIYSTGANMTVSDCNFVNNSGTTGGAIYSTGANMTVSDCNFVNNKASSKSLSAIDIDQVLTFTIIGSENYINAIYTTKDMIFDNVTYYWNGTTVNSDVITPIKSEKEIGINITLEIYNSNNILVDNITCITNSNGQIKYDYNHYAGGIYSYKAYHPDDSYYTYIETTGTFTVPEYNIIVLNNQTYYTTNNITTKINATIKDNQTNTTINPTNIKLLFILATKS